MSLTQVPLAGRKTTFDADSKTGVITQNAGSMEQVEDMGGGDDPGSEASNSVKVCFHGPMLLATAVCHGAETDGETHNFAVFNKDCPYKILIHRVTAIILDETDTIAADTLQVFRGDGASSEAFTAITDAMAINEPDDTVCGDQEGVTTYDQDAAVIDADESLRLQMVLADSSNHNVAIKVRVEYARCISDE